MDAAMVRTLPGGRRLSASIATLLVVVAMLTVMAPWGTQRLALPQRAEYFLLCGLCWQGGLQLARRGMRRFGLGGTGVRQLSLMVLLGALPGCAGILVTIRLMLGHWVPLLPLFTQTLVLGLGIAFAYRGLFLVGQQSAVAPPMPEAAIAGTEAIGEPDPAATFLGRYAPDLAGRRLLALQAEDHYLRIHTDAGSALVLLRLRDAVAALGAEAGWQPHRSFWLPHGINAAPRRRGQSWEIVLADGLVVPVSRAVIPAMRGAGFTV